LIYIIISKTKRRPIRLEDDVYYRLKALKEAKGKTYDEMITELLDKNKRSIS